MRITVAEGGVVDNDLPCDLTERYYQVKGDVLLVLSVLADGLSAPVKMEEYTDEEYRSVLAQMEANRGHGRGSGRGM